MDDSYSMQLNMRKAALIAGLSLFAGSLFAQSPYEVSQERMEEIYEEVKTPYKYGLAVVPQNNDYKIDCPTVFRKGNKWYMTYVVYNGPFLSVLHTSFLY